MRRPLLLDLTGRRVVVVGAGVFGARRAVALRDDGADVLVVAPVFLDGLDAEPGLTLARRPFAPGDLDGAWLVLACTDSDTVNREVADQAERAGVWCVRGDAAEASPAWLPAAGTVGDVTVAVSAGGDPTRAARIRDGVLGTLRTGELGGRRQRSGEGRVTLVGGGPGDPDLLTVGGRRALLEADVVVVDRLGPSDVVTELDPAIEVVDVGKVPGGPAAEQSAINQLLVDRARAGARVVRLKGGDPFVFGRGTEEVDACLAAGVPVSVVPGITSATAAATLAGVGLTERGTTAQFSVVSGHLPPDDPQSTIDWAGLAAGNGTIVLLMAVGNLAAIAAALIAGGRSPQTPAAAVESASLPTMRVLRARLGELATTARNEGLSSPAVVVIGDVVRL